MGTSASGLKHGLSQYQKPQQSMADSESSWFFIPSTFFLFLHVITCGQHEFHNCTESVYFRSHLKHVKKNMSSHAGNISNGFYTLSENQNDIKPALCMHIWLTTYSAHGRILFKWHSLTTRRTHLKRTPLITCQALGCCCGCCCWASGAVASVWTNWPEAASPLLLTCTESSKWWTKLLQRNIWNFYRRLSC